jgi:cobalt-zinc-cadmium efflux system outer membrane protein
MGGAPAPTGIAAPRPLPITTLPVYGPLALPSANEEEGPRDGLTLDEAIERLVRDNLDLRSKFFELPQAKADVLTAGLRANPIFYADGQLIPYGRYARARPGGPPQYDVNISQPFDLSRKRQARTVAAERAVSVLEAQFQNAVRAQIDNLYTTYVDVLAARETVRFAQASVEGLDRVLKVSETLFKKANVTRPEVGRFRIQKQAADFGLREARDALLRRKLSLAALLNIPPDQAEALELRGTIADLAPAPSSIDELVRLALDVRPDLVAQRLSIQQATANVQLAKANRFADVYVLYQPYTFQDNSPFGTKSSTSWALGVTVPVPIYDRNQGNLLRAGLNVTQTEVGSIAMERAIAQEVIRAEREYDVSRAAVAHFERNLLPFARQMLDDAFRLFTKGEGDALSYSLAQRDYNDAIRQYRDALVRHRRSMLALNTAVGRRVLP